MAKWSLSLIACLLQCFAVNTVEASHVIGFPNLNYVSHSRGLWKLGKELTSRGHRYTHVLPNITKEKTYPDINVVIFNTSVTSQQIEDIMVSLGKLSDHLSSMLLAFPKILKENKVLLEKFCEDMFDNEEVMSKLKASADLVLCDLSNLCCPIAAEVLKVPQVGVTTTGFIDPFVSVLLEMPLSFLYMEQSESFGSPSTSHIEQFTFTTRLKNFFSFHFAHAVFINQFASPNLWEKYARKDSKYDSAAEAYWKEKGLVLVSHDFALSGHYRPLNANVKVIGPLLAGPSQPLPTELDSFMRRSERVVVVSFGTVLSQYPAELLDTVAAGLSQVPTQVLWKHSGSKPSAIGNNTKLVPWIPQNDILGHKSTVLFLTHGGVNSLHESIYHSVPVVVMPLFGDQLWSASVCLQKNIGLTLDKNNLTPAKVTEAITEVLNNDVYKENIMKISKVFKSRRITPAEEGVDWIEYALDNDGGLHLRSPAVELPFYQLYMLDVFLFIGIIKVLFVLLVVKLCRCICYRQKKQVSEKKKQ